MQYRSLGKNGPKVSAVSIGTRSMTPNRDIDSTESSRIIKVLETAIEKGINFINTADFYSMGLNEMQIGKAIKGKRDKVFLSVKTGLRRSPTGDYLGLDCTPSSIKNFCNYSLTRLGVEVIDLYQPARIDPNVPLEDTVGAIADLIKEGKVRYLGMSEVNARQLKIANEIYPVSALEIEYSLATRFIEHEILPMARSLEISVIPYSVLYYGLLTGDINGPFSKSDYRSTLPRFNSENLTANLEIIDFLKDFSAQKGYSPSQIAVAWLLNQGNDIIPIIGMGCPERVSDNLKALEIKFTNEELLFLDSTFSMGAIKGDRYPETLKSIIPS